MTIKDLAHRIANRAVDQLPDGRAMDPGTARAVSRVLATLSYVVAAQHLGTFPVGETTEWVRKELERP
jgi:hypothetical protein